METVDTELSLVKHIEITKQAIDTIDFPEWIELSYIVACLVSDIIGGDIINVGHGSGRDVCINYIDQYAYNFTQSDFQAKRIILNPDDVRYRNELMVISDLKPEIYQSYLKRINEYTQVKLFGESV